MLLGIEDKNCIHGLDTLDISPLLLVILITTTINAYINTTSYYCDRPLLGEDIQAEIKLVEPVPGVVTGYTVVVNITLLRRDLVDKTDIKTFIVIGDLKQPVIPSIKKTPSNNLVTIELTSQIPLNAKVLLHLKKDQCSTYVTIEPNRKELEKIISHYSEKYNITMPEKRESEKILIEILENITGSLEDKEKIATETIMLDTQDRIREKPSYYVGLAAFILSLLILVDYLLSRRASWHKAVGVQR